MKILYYIPSLYHSGGLERVITQKANYLVNQFDYEVVILTSEGLGKEPFFKLSSKIKVVDIDTPIDVALPSNRVLKLFLLPFRFLKFRRRFIATLYKERPNITISTLRRELLFLNGIKDGSVKIGEFHITRSVYHSNSPTANLPLLKFFKKSFEKRLLKNLSKLQKVVMLTNEEQQRWPELNNTTVIYNPLTIVCDTPSTTTSKVVMAAGRYTSQKGFDLLIEAWSRVAERADGWRLNIYGEGDDQELRALIDKYSLSKSCFLLPPTTNIAKRYSESSIFVLSSRYEGFGLVLCEAMSCGVAVVSFDCSSGPKEIITDGWDGILVESANVEKLAENIVYLIENPSKRVEYGAKAIESSKRFSEEIIMAQWQDLFNNLVEEYNV